MNESDESQRTLNIISTANQNHIMSSNCWAIRWIRLRRD